MTRPAADQRDGIGDRTIDLPASATANRALHEAIAHFYDELAIADERRADDISDELFEQLEALYVATAEESVANVTLAYDLEERDE